MKFNTLFARATKRGRRTRNLAGGEAFSTTPKLELVSAVLTSFLEDKYYESGSTTMKRLRKLIAKVNDDQFVAKTALYARHEAGMRSVSHLIAGELGSRAKGQAWTKRFFDRVVRRPDDVLEILAYSRTVHGKTIPNAMKKGLGSALTRFDGYQLAKYRGGNAGIKLVDAVNLVHPPHNASLRALVSGTLAPAATWETALTQAGQVSTETEKAQHKAAAWTELVRSRKIGYFALLRNLRNILEQAPELAGDAAEMLADPGLIRRSLVLPFRFRTALDSLQSKSGAKSQCIISALSKAADLSLANVPDFVGRTLIAMDTSGSMIGRPMKIGSLFAAVLYKRNANADLMLFSGSARYVTFDKNDATLTIASRIEERAEWSGTNFHAIFSAAKRGYDRVIILSDMQAWIGGHTPRAAFDAYVQRSGKRPRVFSFDLAGHGTLQFPEPDVYALAGWSDKTLDTLKFLERDKRVLVREIEGVEL